MLNATMRTSSYPIKKYLKTSLSVIQLSKASRSLLIFLILSMSRSMLAVLAAVAGLALGTPFNSTTRTLDLEPVYTNGSISVEHISVAGNLDGFKMLTPAARKSADFWYFDVFSPGAGRNETLNVVFFNSGEFQQYPHPLAVQVSGTYANGTDFYFEALADEGVSIVNGYLIEDV